VLTPPFASLLDVEPALARLIGARPAATVGRRPILPVLALAAGAQWSSGAEALGFVVLAGVLVRAAPMRAMAGAGDQLAADGAAWAACSDVRVAVLGDEFTTALGAWPGAAQRLVNASASLPLPRTDDGDGGLLTLLWHVARRWGTLDGDGIVLPVIFERRVLAALWGQSEAHTSAALKRLQHGQIASRNGGRWALPRPYHGPARAQREQLSARVAEQFATARAVTATTAALAHGSSVSPSAD
jgi:CRP/FNR family cyclic AMP-dependent transcriptional regulator